MPDHIERLIDPGKAEELLHHGQSTGNRMPGALRRGGPRRRVTGDPAFELAGLMWSIERIDAPDAWTTTLGSADVLVGVADTGLDFTHSELAPRIRDVVDFTTTEDPPICKTFFRGVRDADLAAEFGGPETTDWNGHGSWIGGNIAAALDREGVNGIAPRVGLVALKISQWCGAAYDSEILDAFLYAADNGIDVVNISFGGYLDRSDPEQDLIYTQYVEAVQYARRHGTTIVASAGNEHVRVGAGGRVLNHGSLTIPGDPLDDLFGLFAAHSPIVKRTRKKGYEMPTVHLISGLPCSGKTTYAVGLRADANCVLFSLDRWLITSFGKYSIASVGHQEHTRRVLACRELIWNTAAEFLRRSVDVILDDGFFLRDHRVRYVELSNAVGARAKIHFMDTPVGVLRTRVEERNAKLPRYNFHIDPETLQGFLGLFEAPSEYEGAELVVVQSFTQPGSTGTNA